MAVPLAPLPITTDQLMLGRILLHDQHGLRCIRAALAVAHRLDITDSGLLTELAYGAFFHDIGKARIHPWIVDKAGPLDPDEMTLMRQHPVAGEELITGMFVNGHARQIVRHHHEKWNGKGYPDQLEGEDIPMLARIVAPIDTYDALRMKRNYPRYDADGRRLPEQAVFSHREAMAIIEGESGRSFDPKVVRAFRKLKDEEFR